MPFTNILLLTIEGMQILTSDKKAYSRKQVQARQLLHGYRLLAEINTHGTLKIDMLLQKDWSAETALKLLLPSTHTASHINQARMM